MQDQKITIEVIETKEFHVAARGYNQHEVDEFLDSICDELEHIEAKMAELEQENDRLKNQAVPQPKAAVYQAPAAPVSAGADGTFREILEMAQRVKDQTIADAKAKAAEIVEHAEIEVKARLGSLNEEKAALENEMDEIRESIQEYKNKFAALIASAQEALDGVAL
nr:DivIVA domain-containing protein [Clostridia bacterium]